MSPNFNISFRDKADIIDVFRIHSAKVDEAVEALALLKQAMYALGAGEPLRAVLTDGKNPLSQLMADELVENVLFSNLRDADQYLREARASLRNFLRVFRDSYALYEAQGVHHE